MSLRDLVDIEEENAKGFTGETYGGINTEDTYVSTYNPMEEMKNMGGSGISEEVLKNSKLPKEILDSFMSKPPIVNEGIVKDLGGGSVDKLEKREGWAERVRELSNITGSRTTKASSSSGYSEVAPMSLQAKASNSGSYESIMLQILDRLHRLEENVESLLSVGLGNPELKTFQVSQSGDFMFLDSEGNVYKSKLEYIGKRKKK